MGCGQRQLVLQGQVSGQSQLGIDIHIAVCCSQPSAAWDRPWHGHLTFYRLQSEKESQGLTVW